MDIKRKDELLQNTLKKASDIQNEKIKTLLEVWIDIGYGEDVIERRLGITNDHVESLFNDMITEAENERAEIADQVNVLLTKIRTLRKRLRISGPLDGFDHASFIAAIPQLKAKIKEYETQIENYLANVKRLLHEEAKLCASLGRKPKEICTNPLPLESEINEFENYVESLRQLLFEREEEFLQLKMDILKNLDDLNEKPTLDFHQQVVKGEEKSFPVTDENMQLLKEWHLALQTEVEEKKLIVAELREKLTTLWELLEENTEYRTRFTSKIVGFSNETINKLHAEIKRCEDKKKANIKIFVDKLRAEIVEWWDKCWYGDKQREEFVLFNSDCYNEDLLMLHELQLAKLKKQYENTQKIYTLLQKRDELWKKCILLAEKANCPNRFKNRGGELLKEERERKEVGIKLPEIEKQILEEVQQYEQQSGKPFLIYDMKVEDIIQRDLNKFREGQNAKLSAKKKARDNTVTPSTIGKSLLRPTTSTVSINNTGVKRKLLASTPQTVTPKRNKKVSPVKLPKTFPKIKINNRTVKVSTSIRRKLNAKRRSKDGISPCIRAQNVQTPIVTKEYEMFKEGVSARSSVFLNANQKETTKRPKTPQKILTVINRSPKTPKEATKLRPVSPLPIIF